MPRYYFQIEHGGVRPDREGSLHRDIDAARIQAVRSLAEMLDERREKFWADQPVRVVVFDAEQQRLFTVEVAARAG